MICFTLSLPFCDRMITFYKPPSLLVRNINKFRQTLERSLIIVFPEINISNLSNPHFGIFKFNFFDSNHGTRVLILSSNHTTLNQSLK